MRSVVRLAVVANGFRLAAIIAARVERPHPQPRKPVAYAAGRRRPRPRRSRPPAGMLHGRLAKRHRARW